MKTDDNPHKTKHVDECMKALGYTGSYHNNDIMV
jgi:hypothetical protein